MNLNEPVSTIMSRQVVVANKFHSLTQVLQMFSEFGMHHLPMVDGLENIIGIISSNDVLKLFTNPKYKETGLTIGNIDDLVKVADIMTSDPVTVGSKTSIKDAVQIFAQHHFLALPVVDEGKIVGIVSVKDIMHLLAYFE